MGSGAARRDGGEKKGRGRKNQAWPSILALPPHTIIPHPCLLRAPFPELWGCEAWWVRILGGTARCARGIRA